jgi:multidrug efflux pump subunit AcrA (membrane-fusion protein)
VTWVLVGVVVVLAVAVAVLARQFAAARGATQRATQALDSANATVQAVNRQLDEAREQVIAARDAADAAQAAAEQAEIRAELAESGLAFTQQTASSSAARAHLEALWALACLEQGRAWRLTMAMPEETPTVDGPNSLWRTVEREIERIREETGTPGHLSASLPDEMAAGDAVVVLRALQGLMAILARYSDAFDLHLSIEDERVVAGLTCEAFDGPDTVADEATSLLRALGPVQGEIDVDRDEAGRLAARLVIPLAG